jgi:DNA recombination protein RmuC
MDIETSLSLLAVLLVGLLLGAGAGWLVARGRALGRDAATSRRELESRAADHAVVREGLQRLHDQLRDVEQHRVSWQSQLKQQVDEVRHSTESLRRETSSLATALRRPQVRGRWGELHLRRAVELAGLVARCDFDEQVSLRRTPVPGSAGTDALLRPDLVVHLAGGKQVVVDAKVPLDAFLDATSADDEDEQLAHLRRHARQLRQHVDVLAGKAYWRSLPASPEFVVLFVPGESFLSAALEADPSLIEYAATRQVVLATPTTLIALLRTVAHAWTQEALADKAREIHLLARELHERIATMGDHLDKVGRSLTSAVGAYNRAVGSLESRVLVSARRLQELEVTEAELATPGVVADAPRQLSAAELLDAVAEPRGELPGPSEGPVAADDPSRRTA